MKWGFLHRFQNGEPVLVVGFDFVHEARNFINSRPELFKPCGSCNICLSGNPQGCKYATRESTILPTTIRIVQYRRKIDTDEYLARVDQETKQKEHRDEAEA